MEIYAPLAERLGIWQMKWELEDLAFKVLEPERFRELAKLLDTRRKGREGYIERAIAELEPKLKAAGIEADLQGRPKHIYSIAKKMQRKGAEFGEIYDVYAIRILVDDVKGLLRGPGHRPRVVAPHPRPVRRLHRRSEEQPVPVAAHGGDRARRQAARDPDPDAPDAPGVGGRDRRPLALQGRIEVRPRVRRQAGLAAPAHGLAARRQRRHRVRRGHQARHLPGPGLRVHPEGRHQGSAGGRHAARLRLPHPHRRRPPHDRGEGQQPPGAARLPPQERRHRRDRHHQGRARPVARLAERRPHPATPAKRSANGSSARTATRTSSTAGSRWSGSCAASPGPRSRVSASTRSATLRKQFNYETVDDFYAAIGYGAVGAQSVVTRLGVVDDAQSWRCRPSRRPRRRSGPVASGSRASATCWSASRSAATRSRATRSPASSRAARASPSTCARVRP